MSTVSPHTEEEGREILLRYKHILKTSYVRLSPEDLTLIRAAFDLMMDAHQGVRRKSGEPYIYHPLAVAQIVAEEIGLGAVAIASALLHDVVEDTDYTVEDIERHTNAKVASIVEGLTKISQVNDSNVSLQAENFRKMLLTLSDDIRVILIKLADRLHNMMTLDAMPSHKQLKIASETLFIYAPLAHRLGLYSIKTELEDLALRYTEPKMYHHIEQKEIEDKEKQNAYIDQFSSIIRDKLQSYQVDFSIEGRPKSIYSIRNKMIKQGVPYEDVFDKFAIRVVFKSDKKDEKFIAWKIYSIITDCYRSNPRRLRDWISQPKTTGYEALHITVYDEVGGRWVEVQIRSERMHEIAEKGYAAHYKYKNGANDDNVMDIWINRLKDVLENPESNAIDFVDNFKMNLYTKEVYVYTPQGKIISLPKGSSALDFAYAIHTKIGETCSGVMVNGILKPFSYQVKNGDMIKVLTSPNQKPKTAWLDYVKTSKARTRIKAELRNQQRLEVNHGRDILRRKLRYLKIAFNKDVENNLVAYFKLSNSQEVFKNVALGLISNNDIRDFVRYQNNTILNIFRRRSNKFDKAKKPVVTPKEEEVAKELVFGSDNQSIVYTMAKCCHPVKGDEVFGFLSTNGLKVHRVDCENAVELQSQYAYRILQAQWVEAQKVDKVEQVKLIIKAIDRQGLANDILTLISKQMKVDIKKINFDETNGIFNGEITLAVFNFAQLQDLLKKLKQVDGIKSIQRQ